MDAEIWERLFSKYGGQEVRRHSTSVPTEDQTRPDYTVEVNLRKFKILTWPKVKYFSQHLSLTIYASRSDTVKELLNKICDSDEM